MHEKVDTLIEANNVEWEKVFFLKVLGSFTLESTSERQEETK